MINRYYYFRARHYKIISQVYIFIQPEKLQSGRIDPELQGVPSQHARRRTAVRPVATILYRIALQSRFRNHERRHLRPRPENRAIETDRRKSLPGTVRLLRQPYFRKVRVTVTTRRSVSS